MRVCLVSASTLTAVEHTRALPDDLPERIPLGLLTVAGALERAGLRPELADLDASYPAFLASSGGRRGFAHHVAASLARRRADVYGFGTICSSYPLTLRIASALKALRPGCRIVLGGPQATAAADETLAAFPAVDVVVRGEGEAVLPALVDALASSRDLASVPGLSYRAAGGVARTPDAPLLDDLDALPAPAYHLVASLGRAGALPLEIGRGCPFSCTFCSTSRFFGRRYRLKSPGRVLEEMRRLHRGFGATTFVLVHDDFTADRSRVGAFCDALASAPERFTWTCSSRADALDDELVDRMTSAGCIGFFVGIESGSRRIQRAIGKRLDPAAARACLRRVDRRGITSSAAFIAGFPDETREDLAATVDLFLDALRLDGVEPQLALLSPLAGTPVHARHRHELVHDEIVSDVAFQGDAQDPADVALIRRHPDVFSSFWSVPTRHLDRRELHALRAFLLGTQFELRWLLLATARVAGGGLRAFRAFRRWRAARALTPRAVAAYYRGPRFGRDFVRFALVLSARRGRAAHALAALARHHAATATAPEVRSRRPRPATHPARAAGVRVTRIACDGAALIRCLREGGDLSRVSPRPSALATRVRDGRRELLRLTDEAADLLELCDGTRDARAVGRAFERLHPRAGGVPAEVACAVGLDLLRRSGLLAPATSAVRSATAPRSRASRAAPSAPRGAADRDRRASSARAGGPPPPGPRHGGRADRGSAP